MYSEDKAIAQRLNVPYEYVTELSFIIGGNLELYPEVIEILDRYGYETNTDGFYSIEQMSDSVITDYYKWCTDHGYIPYKPE